MPGTSATLSLGQGGPQEPSSQEPTPAPVAPRPSFRGIVALVTPTSGEACHVTPQNVNGETYLFLPAGANLAALEIALPEPYTIPVYLSASKTGPFRTGAFDVRSCQRDSQGIYTVYVRYFDGMAPYAVKIAQSSGVSALFLTSSDPVQFGRAFVEASADHSATAQGAYAMVTKDAKLAFSGDLKAIRGRGASSWYVDKRSYQIKLDKKASLVDGQAANSAKTWVLIANAYDETMLRNYLAYKAALAAGLTHAPDCTYVDLYYDGEYRGLYLLSEKAQIGTGRVEIDEVENYSDYGDELDNHDTAQAKNTYGRTYQYVRSAVSPALPQQTGYLLELDKPGYVKERCWFDTSIGPIVVKSPDNLSKSQMAFISQQMQRAIDEAAKANGNMAAYFDMPSLARTFLVNELAKNPDWLRYSSTFFYFDNSDGLIHSGPVWDFDLAFGVHKYEGFDEYIDPSGWASLSAMFFGDNAQFKSALKTSLQRDVLPTARALVGAASRAGVPTVRGAARAIAQAQKMDDILWDTASAPVVVVRPGSFDAAVNYTHNWLVKRIAWLEKHATSFPRTTPAGKGLLRLAGANALETMNSIVNHAGFAKGKTVVLTTSKGYWDALTAAGLAGLAQAPVLMTDGATLSAQTAAQLRKLQPSTIAVCGGPAAVTDAVVTQARAAASRTGNAASVKAIRCAGSTATDTAIDIFAKAPGVTGSAWAHTAFVCTNATYHDALAAAPISYATGMPIFLSQGKASFSPATIRALQTGGIYAVYVVGGEAAIAPSAVEQLQNAGIAVAGRLSGATAIETSEEVARFGLAKGLHATNMGVATSHGYWDSLSGAALCGKNNSVLVLAGNPQSHSIGGFIADHSADIARLYVFGGEAALDAPTANAIRKAAAV